MNLFKSFFILFGLTWFLTLFLPWWSVVLPALLIGAWKIDHAWRGLIIGFLATATAWWAQAWITSFQNEDLLSSRLSVLIFGIEMPGLFLFATGMISGVLGALATVTGVHLRKVLS